LPRQKFEAVADYVTLGAGFERAPAQDRVFRAGKRNLAKVQLQGD
jgi:hypothetical protein